MALNSLGDRARKPVIRGQIRSTAAQDVIGPAWIEALIFARYSLVGILATLVHYAVLVTLVELAVAGAGWSAALGAACGALAAYTGNRRFTFLSRAPHQQALPRFVFIAVVGAIANGSIVWAGTELLRMHYLVSQAIATALVLGFGYSVNRRWSFA